MAHLRCDLRSECMDMMTSVTLVLPEDGTLPETPLIYLLHGLADNCTGWSRYTSVERYARMLGAALVIPEVQRSFYTDMVEGLPYYEYIHDELPELMKNLFRVTEDPSRTYVMGLSMGGYGALKCVLRTPERYAGAAAFSAVTDLQQRVDAADSARRTESRAIFGDALRLREDDDLFCLAEKREGRELPPIYMACGEQDELYEQNVRFADTLKELGASVRFEHWTGGHEWAFWDRAVSEAMHHLLRPAQNGGDV